jgi:pyrophosphatase PpaX
VIDVGCALTRQLSCVTVFGVKRYQTYLFDADGTIIDTLDLIYQCFKGVWEARSLPPLSREAALQYVGIPLPQQYKLLYGFLEASQLAQIEELHLDIQSQIYRDYLKLFPGVADCLGTLKARGAKLGVVTSRRLRSLRPYLELLGILNCFDVLVTPSDTTAHKPDPAPVQFALDKLGTPPAHALMVGDAPFDIQSGAAAGTDTAFVAWSHNRPEEIVPQPTWILTDLAELL